MTTSRPLAAVIDAPLRWQRGRDQGIDVGSSQILG